MNLQTELIAEYDQEIETTRKILQAIPEDADFTWKASPKNMTLGRLAAHVTETAGEWPRDALSKPGLVFDMATYTSWKPTTKAEVLDRFEKDTVETRALLATMDPARWDDRWTMTAQMEGGTQTWIDDTRYRVYRHWVLNHLIHHRAQLGRDLRTLGVPIPGSYGPSADKS
jgi:uncharacterized damage-inducible protein DinB